MYVIKVNVHDGDSEYLIFDNENDIKEFIKDKGCTEDGHASERTADLIEEIMEK